jgi:integrase
MSRMENDVFPDLGHRTIGDIEAGDLLAVIRKIEARGVIDTAKRIKNYCGEVFRYGIAEGKCKTDPSVYVRGALQASKPVKHRARVKMADLPVLLAKVRAYDGDALTRLALQFTILTAVRTIETRFAAWHEFEQLDGPAPLWRIGAERMKMNAEHLVPLPRQAVAVLLEIRTLGGGEMLFAADTKSGVISENTMLYALYRMGYHSRQTVHGFRGIFSTVLNETGSFETDWIERQLSHVEEDQVRAAYNSALYLRQRTALLQYWADFIDEQTEFGALIG